jgi:hypothetical protein
MKVTSVLLALSLLLPFSMAAQARSDSARAHVTQHGTFVRDLLPESALGLR